MPDYEITESWKDKKYEAEFTDYFFNVIKRLSAASNLPILFNLRTAFNDIRSLSYGLIYSKEHIKEFKNKIKPTLEDIDKILYGQLDDPRVVKKMADYMVYIEKNRHGQSTVMNAQNIITQLWEILFFIKQWAYESGFFVVKPYSRKVGKEAMDDAFSQ